MADPEIFFVILFLFLQVAALRKITLFKQICIHANKKGEKRKRNKIFLMNFIQYINKECHTGAQIGPYVLS